VIFLTNFVRDVAVERPPNLAGLDEFRPINGSAARIEEGALC
jgi:hypothetical protein